MKLTSLTCIIILAFATVAFAEPNKQKRQKYQQAAAKKRQKDPEQRQEEQKKRQQALKQKLVEAKEQREAAMAKRREYMAKKQADIAAKQAANKSKFATAAAKRRDEQQKRKDALNAKLATLNLDKIINAKLAAAKKAREQLKNDNPKKAPKNISVKPKSPRTPKKVKSPETAKPLFFNAPVDPGMALDTMEEWNKNINAKAIKSHGCHCAKYSRTENIGGFPVDELDSACLDWSKKLRCITLESGACKNGIEFTSFPIQLQPNGELSKDIDFACALAGDQCVEAVCRINYDWGLRLWESVGKNGPGSDKFKDYINAQCMPKVPVASEKVCKGEAPNVVIVEKDDAVVCQDIGGETVEYAPDYCPGLGCNAGGQHPDCRFCSVDPNNDRWYQCL